MSSAELVLTYENARWRARGPNLDVAHPELRSLDALLQQRLAASGTPQRVLVRFDMSSLPAWLRQYHTHYCNYVLHVAQRGSVGD